MLDFSDPRCRGAQGGGAQGGRAPGEGLVPMINVVFLLLIFFLMGARLAPPPPVAVDLPQGPGAREAAPGAAAALYLDAAGGVHFAGAQGEQAWARLAAHLSAHLSAGQAGPVTAPATRPMTGPTTGPMTGPESGAMPEGAMPEGAMPERAIMPGSVTALAATRPLELHADARLSGEVLAAALARLAGLGVPDLRLIVVAP